MSDRHLPSESPNPAESAPSAAHQHATAGSMTEEHAEHERAGNGSHRGHDGHTGHADHVAQFRRL
ncbi:MAG TPA: hypothetical protein PJ998_08435, partial [Terrimesophilobacter sp.]|nr:hypothetical protein [Terrimesophilobacter sp.]